LSYDKSIGTPAKAPNSEPLTRFGVFAGQGFADGGIEAVQDIGM
jgi:hypothetical protein